MFPINLMINKIHVYHLNLISNLLYLYAQNLIYFVYNNHCIIIIIIQIKHHLLKTLMDALICFL